MNGADDFQGHLTGGVVEYPIVVVYIRARIAEDAVLYVGRFDDNEPLIEVIAEIIDDDDTVVVFHAMYLVPSTIRLARIEGLSISPTPPALSASRGDSHHERPPPHR